MALTKEDLVSALRTFRGLEILMNILDLGGVRVGHPSMIPADGRRQPNLV